MSQNFTNGHYTLNFSKKNQKWFWNLKAPNHEIISRGTQMYSCKSDAEAVICEVQKHSSCASNYERFDAKDGKPSFRLLNPEGDKLAFGETYESSAGRDKGIEACQRYGGTKVIIDADKIAGEVGALEKAGSLGIATKVGTHCAPVKPKPGGYYGS